MAVCCEAEKEVESVVLEGTLSLSLPGKVRPGERPWIAPEWVIGLPTRKGCWPTTEFLVLDHFEGRLDLLEFIFAKLSFGFRLATIFVRMVF